MTESEKKWQEIFVETLTKTAEVYDPAYYTVVKKKILNAFSFDTVQAGPVRKFITLDPEQGRFPAGLRIHIHPGTLYAIFRGGTLILRLPSQVLTPEEKAAAYKAAEEHGADRKLIADIQDKIRKRPKPQHPGKTAVLMRQITMQGSRISSGIPVSADNPVLGGKNDF